VGGAAARQSDYSGGMKRDAEKPSIAHHLRDGAGHLDPKVAADLQALVNDEAPADDHAFLHASRSKEPVAEQLGESFVAQVTSGGEEAVDEPVEEETGGPFVETTGQDEFASGTDRSNPKDATREPFPTT
jgi:hypothetical protein